MCTKDYLNVRQHPLLIYFFTNPPHHSHPKRKVIAYEHLSQCLYNRAITKAMQGALVPKRKQSNNAAKREKGQIIN